MNLFNCTFIGLGNMGRELCSRIGGARFPTLAYDLNPAASKYAEENYENLIQSHLLPAVKNSVVIFSCLPNSIFVREIVDKLLQEKGILKNIHYWIDTTSGNPRESKKIAPDLKKNGDRFF